MSIEWIASDQWLNTAHRIMCFLLFIAIVSIIVVVAYIFVIVIYGAPFWKKLITFWAQNNFFMQHHLVFNDMKYFFVQYRLFFVWRKTIFRATSSCFCRHQMMLCATSNFLFWRKVVFRAASNFCFRHCLE